MGFLGIFKEKSPDSESQEEKILLGTECCDILIPDHAKPKETKTGSLKVKLVHSENTKNKFSVNGIYDIGTEIMLSGVVESGKIKKRMKTSVDSKNVVVTDIKVGSTSVTELLLHEEGTIFLKGKTMQQIKYGNVLEFK